MKKVSRQEIVNTLLTDGEIVLDNYDSSQRIQIQQYIFVAKKDLKKQGCTVEPVYVDSTIYSYERVKIGQESNIRRIKQVDIKTPMLPRIDISQKSAAYRSVYQKAQKHLNPAKSKISIHTFSDVHNQSLLKQVLKDLGWRQGDSCMWSKTLAS